MRGFSARNLRNMRSFYEEWIDLDRDADQESNLADASAKLSVVDVNLIWQTRLPNSQEFPLDDFLHIGFSHHILILSKAKEYDERLFYIQKTASEKLSVELLKKSIKNESSTKNTGHKLMTKISKRKRTLSRKAFKQKIEDNNE